MNGNEYYESKYTKKINCVIEKSEYGKVLQSFYYQLRSGTVESEASRYNYIRIISAFLKDTGKKIDEVNLDDYNYFRQSKSNCKSSYQIVVYTALKQFALYLFDSGRTDRNYMEKAKRPKAKDDVETIEKRSHNYLTLNEIKQLKGSVNDGVGTKRAKSFQKKYKERDNAIIMLFLTTGLRCAAVVKLDTDSIDIGNKTLTTTEKGGKVRNIILSDQMIECLNVWIDKRKEFVKDNNEQALFVSLKGTRLKEESIAAIVSKYASTISGKEISPHKLRATYATQVYNQVHDIELVQELMGHSNVNTTKLYIREKENRTNVGSDIMSQILF